MTPYVPSKTALNVGLSMSELTIDGIVENKDLSINAGDLKLGDLDAEGYASAKIGRSIGSMEDAILGGQASDDLDRTKVMMGMGNIIYAHVNIGKTSLQKERLYGRG